MSPPGRLGLVVVAALLLLPAASAGTPGSGLYGVVMKGPISPVCRAGVPCDAPAQVTLVFRHGGHRIAAVRSSKAGRYRLALAPGFYDVQTAERVGISRAPKPHAVHVSAGRLDRVDFFIDTGIR